VYINQSKGSKYIISLSLSNWLNNVSFLNLFETAFHYWLSSAFFSSDYYGTRYWYCRARPCSRIGLFFVSHTHLAQTQWPQSKQCLFLVAVGIGLISFGLSKGQSFSLELILSSNLQLISMLVAVSFLGLTSSPAVDSTHGSPQGLPAARVTIIGVHLLR
jgi:hypothetical protein